MHRNQNTPRQISRWKNLIPVSRYHSIYATQQRKPSRWPLALLILLVVVVSAATGAMIAQGETPRTLLDRAASHDATETPDPTLAFAVDTPTEPATAEPTATEESTPTVAPTATAEVKSASVGSPASEGEAALTDVDTPESLSAVKAEIERA